jgi:hypothetical protein
MRERRGALGETMGEMRAAALGERKAAVRERRAAVGERRGAECKCGRLKRATADGRGGRKNDDGSTKHDKLLQFMKRYRFVA